MGFEYFPDPSREDTAEIKSRIAAGHRYEEPNGFVYFATPGVWSWTGADHLNEAVERHVDANRAKISGGPGERHLFIWVEFHSTPTWVQVTDGPLPDTPPRLDDVDVVWVAARDSVGVHLWRAGASGWAKLE